MERGYLYGVLCICCVCIWIHGMKLDFVCKYKVYSAAVQNKILENDDDWNAL